MDTIIEFNTKLDDNFIKLRTVNGWYFWKASSVNGTQFNLQSTSPFPDQYFLTDCWYQFVYVQKNLSSLLYVNGILMAQGNQQSIPINVTRNYNWIGSAIDDGIINAVYDDIVIFDEALDQSTVLNNFIKSKLNTILTNH